MTDREVLLANAAQAIREQRADGQKKDERFEPPEGTSPTASSLPAPEKRAGTTHAARPA